MTAYEQNPYRRQGQGHKKKKIKKKHKARIFFLTLFAIGFIILAAWFLKTKYIPSYRLRRLANAKIPDYIDQQILDFDSNSRSGEKLEAYKSIVIHYVGNPGSTAQGNHNYYANPESNVSSHFVIGLEGEIIQCLPLDEKSAASNWRNNDTISIEVCHPDDSGAFTSASYASLIKLTRWLVDIGKLNPRKDIIRHYDITGKICPKYYVDHPDAWEQFKIDVANYND